MTRQYMDIMPARSAKKVVKKKIVVSREAPKSVPKVTTQVKTELQYSARLVAPMDEEPLKEIPKLGEIEDLTPRSSEPNLPSLPINEEKRPEIKQVKAQKVGHKGVAFREKAPEDKKTYEMPKSPFINQEKVVKRPLSKNVYQKKVEAPKEEPKGPVTIIEKPEKDAKVGLIIAIILTIILGAAAGTVAFLLIPK